MSPTTRSDSMKKKLQNREAYSRSAKRRLENDYEATTSDAQIEINKPAKRAAKNTKKAVSLKSQKRKHFNVGINTPKITKKPKESEHVIVSDDDFQSNQFIQKKKKRTCQFRSTVVTYNPKKSPITEGVRRIISQTLFAAVFECFFGEKLTVSKSNNQMGMILNAYNHEDNTFTFGSTQLEITMRDYADILGMNVDGEYILEKVTPERELLKKPISVIEVQERDHNLARLVLVDICIKFLFANGMGSLSMVHVRALEDLNEISKYAWAKEVAKFLVEKLITYKTRDSNSKNTGGCAYIILYWLCLKTNIISPIPGREEAVPLILRRDLNVLERLLKKMTFKDICVAGI